MPRWPYASAPSKERHPAADDYPIRTPRAAGSAAWDRALWWIKTLCDGA